MTPAQARTGADQADRLRSLVQALRSTSPLPDPHNPPDPHTPHVSAPPADPEPVRPRAHVLAIASGKGGVGKTLIAVNLALHLACADRRVVLVDADIGAANADIMLGMRPQRRMNASLRTTRDLGRLCQPIRDHLGVVAGAVGARPDPGEGFALYRRLHELDALGDLIIVDLPAGLDPLVLATLAMGDVALIVSTPEATAIADAYATIKAVTALRAQHACTPSQHMSLVVNQAPGDRAGRLAHERLAMVATRFLGRRVPLAGVLHSDPRVPGAIAKRIPIVESDPETPWAITLRRLGDDLVEAIPPRASTTRTLGF